MDITVNSETSWIYAGVYYTCRSLYDCISILYCNLYVETGCNLYISFNKLLYALDWHVETICNVIIVF